MIERWLAGIEGAARAHAALGAEIAAVRPPDQGLRRDQRARQGEPAARPRPPRRRQPLRERRRARRGDPCRPPRRPRRRIGPGARPGAGPARRAGAAGQGAADPLGRRPAGPPARSRRPRFGAGAMTTPAASASPWQGRSPSPRPSAAFYARRIERPSTRRGDHDSRPRSRFHRRSRARRRGHRRRLRVHRALPGRRRTSRSRSSSRAGCRRSIR